MDWQKYLKPEVWHPAAKLFPLMGEKELTELAEDIRRNKLLHPITMLGDLVLDGRNRLLACARADVEPWFVQWTEKKMGPVEWVVSQNLRRRHLTSKQAAVIALEAMPLIQAEAKERQRLHGGTAPGRPKSLPQTIGEVISDKHSGEAIERTAILFNTNRQYIQDLKAIRQKDPRLYEAVKKGEMTIPQARRELGLERNRITLLFNPEVSADKKILDFLLRLPRKTRSDTIKEILLQAIEKDESPYLRSPIYPASLIPTSTPGTSPDHELRETQESTEDERIDGEELIDSIVESFTKS